jgi:short-subunit dehydrogenase
MISELPEETNGLTVVTGGSDVLPAAVCENLALKKKRKFIFLGRDESKLKELREKIRELGSESVFIKCDLSSWDDLCQLEFGAVDFLLLGASPAERKLFIESDLKKTLNTSAVGTTAVVYLLAQILPKMSPGGRVLMISSTAAFQPGPGNATYFASKAFQNSLVEALAFELRNKGPSFLLICSGPLPSKKNGISGSFLKKIRSVYLEDVVDGIETQFKRGNVIWVPGRVNQFFRLLISFLPRSFLLKRIQSLMQSI